MAKKDQKKKNYSYNGKDELIGFKELIETRKQEMETSVLPGFFAIVSDPRGKSKDAKVFSLPYMKRTMFSVNSEEV